MQYSIVCILPYTYNVRRPLKDLSSEEFVLGVESDKGISMTGSTPKTNSSELRSLSGRLTLYTLMHIARHGSCAPLFDVYIYCFYTSFYTSL